MTNPDIPSMETLENTEPSRDKVVSRESDEGYNVQINIVQESAVSETAVRTYDRRFGHYFVDEMSEATQLVDEFIAEFMTKSSQINSFERGVGRAYELTVSVSDGINTSSITLDREDQATLELTDHSPDIEKLDEALGKIESEVTNS